MTIAAGFVCSDGVVLGADTQVTGQTIKYSRDKVWVLSAPDASHCVAMAGAGDAVLIRALRDHLASHDQSGRLQLAETLSRLSAVRAGRVRRAGVPGAHGDDLGRANTDYRRRDPLRPLRRPALGRSSPTGSEAGCRRACCSAPSNNGRYSGQWAPTDRRPLAASSTVLRRAVPRPFAFFAVAALCMRAATNRYRPFPRRVRSISFRVFPRSSGSPAAAAITSAHISAAVPARSDSAAPTRSASRGMSGSAGIGSGVGGCSAAPLRLRARPGRGARFSGPLSRRATS